MGSLRVVILRNALKLTFEMKTTLDKKFVAAFVSDTKCPNPLFIN